jgi:hypothetical protein
MLGPFVRGLFRLCAIVGCVAATTTPSHAVFSTSGTFSGIVHASELPYQHEVPRPASYYDGAALTGRFDVFAPDPNADGVGSFNTGGGWIDLSFTLRGETFAYRAGGAPDSLHPGSISLGTASPAFPHQSMEFATDVIRKFDGAALELIGPAGSLFGSIDPAGWLVDTTQAFTLIADFTSPQAWMSFSVSTGDVHFDSTSPVPEPSSAAGLLLGLGLLGWRFRGARGTAAVRAS